MGIYNILYIYIYVCVRVCVHTTMVVGLGVVSFGVWFWGLVGTGGVRGLTKSSWGEGHGPRKNWLGEGSTDHAKIIWGRRQQRTAQSIGWGGGGWGGGQRTAQKVLGGGDNGPRKNWLGGGEIIYCVGA